MNLPSRKWLSLAVCSAALGASAVFAIGSGGPQLPSNAVSAPVPLVTDQKSDSPAKEKEKPKNGEWVPSEAPGRQRITRELQVPTAFPELVMKEPDRNDPKFHEKYEEEFAKLCPRFAGKAEIKIEPTDDTLRKLLKTRLYHGVAEIGRIREIIRIGHWSAAFFLPTHECLVDIEAACLELWGAQPKELIPWLEELVVVTKEFEQLNFIRVLNGSDPPHRLDAARRHRLRAEATLWKAKNPK